MAEKLTTGSDKLEIQEQGVNSLFWADDIVLLGKSAKNLTEMIKMVSEYCKENKLTINCKKTKCLIFNKTGRLLREKFYLNDAELENVREYKYLGFIFTPSGEITSGLKDLRDRGLKAFYSLKNKMGESFNRNITTSLALFESMIKPILLYASDFWGALKLPANNPIETLYMRICKEILGVTKQTTNIGVLLELGKTNLGIDAIKLGVKNWERVRKGNANAILLASYRDAVIEDLPWISSIRRQLEKNGMLSLFINEYPEAPNFINKKLHKRLVDEFHQNGFSAIQKQNSKLRTYALIKLDTGMEKYLTEIKNVKLRINLTKFRLSNHSLMIEKGRYTGLKPEERLCPFCPNLVEDEIHFLLNCHTYRNIRESLMGKVHNENFMFQFFSVEQKFRYLVSKFCNMTADVIYKTLELRDFLLQNPKRYE